MYGAGFHTPSLIAARFIRVPLAREGLVGLLDIATLLLLGELVEVDGQLQHLSMVAVVCPAEELTVSRRGANCQPPCPLDYSQ